MKQFILDDRGVTFTEYSLIVGISSLFFISVLSNETGFSDTLYLLNKAL
jgi:Flp pilus assembly pilin Flp